MMRYVTIVTYGYGSLSNNVKLQASKKRFQSLKFGRHYWETLLNFGSAFGCSIENDDETDSEATIRDRIVREIYLLNTKNIAVGM